MDDQKLSTEQLNSAILTSMLSLAPHGIFTTDTQLRISGWNPWLERHSTATAESVVGRPLMDIVPTLSERRLDQYFRDALNGETKIVSRLLHGYLLPFLPTVPDTGFSYMQQSARISPLLLKGKICGTITTIEDVTEREWQNAILRRERKRHELLSAALAHLLSTRDSESLVPEIFSQIGGHLSLDSYFEYRLRSPAQTLDLHSAAGLTEVQKRRGALNDIADRFCAPCTRTLEPVLLSNLQRSQEPKGAYLKRLGLDVFAAFPLIVGDQVLGSLAFASRTRSNFDRDEMQFLRAVCQYVSFAMDRLAQENKLQASEARFRAMADTVPDIIFTATAGGAFDFINQRFYDFTGMARGSASDFGWMKPLHPDDRKRVENQWRKSVQTAEPYSIEYRLRQTDGTFRWFVARAHPIRDEASEITKWFGAVTDIEDLKQTQLALDEAQTQLRQHAEILEYEVRERTAKLRETIMQLESFSYTVAHDLRAPIRAMDGYAQAIMEDHADALDEGARTHLHNIRRAASRLDSLTLDVLSFTKISTQSIQVAPVELENVVNDVLLMNCALQSPASVVSVERPLGIVLAHPTFLSQAISNLLDNAVKFVATGVAPKVVVRSEIRTAQRGSGGASNSAEADDGTKGLGRSVRLWIEDNGIGIEEANQRNIFRIFERAKSAKGYAGTGVGLAIVAKAVERMNGSYGVESTPGKGSRFWIELPAAP